jgi:hypothetical protein
MSATRLWSGDLELCGSGRRAEDQRRHLDRERVWDVSNPALQSAHCDRQILAFGLWLQARRRRSLKQLNEFLWPQ